MRGDDSFAKVTLRTERCLEDNEARDSTLGNKCPLSRLLPPNRPKAGDSPYQKVAPYPLGSVTHEAGDCRMGDDPKTSVRDSWNRCHDIKNLLDAAGFVTHPEEGTTHTIMALSYRASDHLAEEFRLGNV